MDGIRAWAVGLCAVAVGCTLLQTLAPKGGLGKIYHLLIAAFFLCCLVYPLLNMEGIAELELAALPEEIQSSVLEMQMQEQLIRQIEAAVEKTAGQVLDSYGFSAEKVTPNMTTSNAIRTLSNFANERLITIDGRKIKIIDEDKLKKISKIG